MVCKLTRSGDEKRIKIVDCCVQIIIFTDVLIEVYSDTYTIYYGYIKLVFFIRCYFYKRKTEIASVSFNEIDINLYKDLFLKKYRQYIHGPSRILSLCHRKNPVLDILIVFSGLVFSCEKLSMIEAIFNNYTEKREIFTKSESSF